MFLEAEERLLLLEDLQQKSILVSTRFSGAHEMTLTFRETVA